jgi:hypothetical protein
MSWQKNLAKAKQRTTAPFWPRQILDKLPTGKSATRQAGKPALQLAGVDAGATGLEPARAIQLLTPTNTY